MLLYLTEVSRISHASLNMTAGTLTRNNDNYRLTSADCNQAASASLMELMSLAISRGCRHYAAMAQGVLVPERIREIYHEVLGCALLRAPMPSWFDDFRCGCMVLSDLGNRPQAIAAAADYFDIGDRIGHIARLGLEVDHHAEFWGKLAELFPRAAGPDQLPGISRLAIETRIWGGQRKVVTTWLRTSWRT